MSHAEPAPPRHRRRRIGLAVGTPLALIAGGVLAYGAAFGTFGDDTEPQAGAATVPADAQAAVAAMQPGWNLGNTLDGIPDETAWGRPLTTRALLKSVRAQGFRSIRVPVTWSDPQGAAPDYAIDAAYLKRVKEVTDWALAEGLYVIIDVHHDSWQWVSSMPAEHDKVLARFKPTWTQLAAAFRDAPAQVVDDVSRDEVRRHGHGPDLRSGHAVIHRTTTKVPHRRWPVRDLLCVGTTGFEPATP
ncbi:cellulase family glycosylhydrolase [Streptomyces sp. TRM66268-LWL]|uniref:Cellulase family glycosylhydrolase n=1 Tax=Streptomyces polyasparticus TaxID=2767826 RepID=A0ABR7SEU9_9ACTN|nr:cellulase family glycosylhydrolase [Streptomyces polyasparticus]MBC9713719.1 cellulase family glycosylhydrolase [Streptomyces polyasparticus]